VGETIFHWAGMLFSLHCPLHLTGVCFTGESPGRVEAYTNKKIEPAARNNISIADLFIIVAVVFGEYDENTCKMLQCLITDVKIAVITIN
jgi:hypothetical protein